MESTLIQMPSTLKRDALPEFVKQVQDIEDQSDKWTETLGLTAFPHDTAIWGVLTQIIELIEEQIEHFGHGSQKQREAMMNLGRAGAYLIERLRRSTLPVTPVWLRWTDAIKLATREAILTAHNYEAFISGFTMWHKNRLAVEAKGPNHIRFVSDRSPLDRRIRAYQQGVRLRDWPTTQDNPVDKNFVDDPPVRELVSSLLTRVTVQGSLAIRYLDDSELLSVLRDIYDQRLQPMFRHNPSLDLGGYNLGNFRRFFSVLLAVCSVHELVCAWWPKSGGRYPSESAVMVKTREDWLELICRLSGIPAEQVRLMLSDMTFGSTIPLDIYIHPFVPSLDGQTLFLVPHFILNSRAEENVLRVCSYLRPRYYSAIQNAKENEMREMIKLNVPEQYSILGPLKLPDPALPDIDLVIQDRKRSAALISELKWIRKTVRVIEHIDRDSELEKGLQQLASVRDFLGSSPDFLTRRGIIPAGEPRIRLSYAVVARDHLNSPPEAGEIWLTEFDALIWALKRSERLVSAIEDLRSYRWLPVENADFIVRFERATVAGVTIESEAFHRVELAT